MKKSLIIGVLMTTIGVLACGCGAGEEQQTEPASNAQTSNSPTTDNESIATTGNKVLVAYFTRLPNTESGDDLDAVVQGGGPYGEIGDSYDTADMDAISSASITVTDEIRGNTETVAEWIAADTGGDIFSIETVEKYPVNYDAVIDQGGVEQREDARPELTTHVDDMEEYSIIYLGYPNWYNDMPMALYTFLEEYDMQGKTIVPFCTSAGSGFARSIQTIQELQPNATVIEDGLALPMREVKDAKPEVEEWIASLGITS